MQKHILWANKKLDEMGYTILNPSPKLIQNTQWSEVTRFETDKGFIFLKLTPPNLSIEIKIIDILQKKFHASVPTLIAKNLEEHCFLMQDAGIQLNKYFKDNFQPEILIQTVRDYSTFQISTIDSIDFFLQEGLPDWRIEKLPALYHDLIAHENLLISDGLSKDELIILKKLEPKLISICEKLSGYKIKDTFGHADFHDKNIVINPNTLETTMIDLGEVVITHPFFSFLQCLHMAKENFSISDSQYRELTIACFEPWLYLETEEHLFEILTLIHQCWSIHAVMGEFRLINSVSSKNAEELLKQGRLSDKLRHWLRQNAPA
ncbi:MAG: aminoglycoside phosphotransferase family protein [Gammaproteobacteria bacterium]